MEKCLLSNLNSRKKALIVSSYGIGDILMSSSVIHHLIDEYDVTFCCEEQGKEFLCDDDIKIQTYSRDPKTMIADYSSLKLNKYDVGIATVPNSSEAGELLSRHCNRYVYYELPEESSLRKFHHTIDLNTKLTQRLLKKKLFSVGYWRLKKTKGTISKKVIMHVGPKSFAWRHKAFPISLYQDIANWLIKNGMQPCVIGDDSQKIYAHSIRGAEVCCGLPLGDVVQLLRGSIAFVGNDCGPAHLAAAAGIPTIVFFGPTFSGRTGPWPAEGKNRSIQSIIACGPCHGGPNFESCREPICHNKVSIDDFVSEWRKIDAFFR